MLFIIGFSRPISPMFFLPACSVLVPLVFSCLAVSATPSLSLRVAGPDSVTSVNDLILRATVINTGDETLQILNEPRSPLSRRSTNNFLISHVSGFRPHFIGLNVKYVRELAAASGDGSFTFLAPGQSVDVSHDLSSAYNFTTSGEGDYIVEPRNLFHYLGPDNALVPIYAYAHRLSVSLSGKLAEARNSSHSSKRFTWVRCTDPQKKVVETASTNAKKLVDSSLVYLNANQKSTPRYVNWFGTYDTTRHATVLDHYTKMASNDFTKYTFDCDPESDCDPGDYAWSIADEFGEIHLCSRFWTAPATGSDSQAGTIVHESSHFEANGDTEDYANGKKACEALAKSKPEEAVNNGDSHQYFSENDPPLA